METTAVPKPVPVTPFKKAATKAIAINISVAISGVLSCEASRRYPSKSAHIFQKRLLPGQYSPEQHHGDSLRGLIIQPTQMPFEQPEDIAFLAADNQGAFDFLALQFFQHIFQLGPLWGTRCLGQVGFVYGIRGINDSVVDLLHCILFSLVERIKCYSSSLIFLIFRRMTVETN